VTSLFFFTKLLLWHTMILFWSVKASNSLANTVSVMTLWSTWLVDRPDLCATTCKLVHHPDTVIPCIVVAVIAVGCRMAHTQLSQNDTVPQIRVRQCDSVWQSSDGTWLCFTALTSSVETTGTHVLTQLAKQPTPVINPVSLALGQVGHCYKSQLGMFMPKYRTN